MCNDLSVFRDDLPALPRLHFFVIAKTDLSLLLSGSRDQPRLICKEETSEWGDNDIELDIIVDKSNLMCRGNNDMGRTVLGGRLFARETVNG